VFELGTFVLSIVSFLIVFWIISRVGFKPLGKMLQDRRLYIETQITDAEQGRKEAEGILADQRQLLEQSRQEAKTLLDAARVRADEQAREMIREAQAEAARVLEENRAAIERERTEALNETLTKVAALTVELTTKLLHNHVSEPVHAEMLTEAEKRLGELVC
jgi:F-type H+-transporting ATPase subunit b